MRDYEGDRPFLRGASLPPAGIIGSAAVVGFLGVGVSLVLFVLALRHLGAARTGAYFSLAPFIGAVISVLLLCDPVTIQLVAAGLLMGFSLWLHLHEHGAIEKPEPSHRQSRKTV